MPATRPIIREPRTTSERMEAAVFAFTEQNKPLAPSMHPGQLFTSEGAGIQVKGQLKGGSFSPVNNSKTR